MSTDRAIQEDVLRALDIEAGLNAAEIGVMVHEGAVTLHGTVPTLQQRRTAARTAARVERVRRVTNELLVRPEGEDVRPDDVIAEAIREALAWHSEVPAGAVQAKVSNGWVTLTGRVEWPFQRRAAEASIRYLRSITGITNTIAVNPRPAGRPPVATARGLIAV